MQGYHSKGRLQKGCVSRLTLRSDAAPEGPHQRYCHSIITLRLCLHDKKRAYLQMGDQFDFDISFHGKLLDGYTRAALVECTTISQSLWACPKRR